MSYYEPRRQYCYQCGSEKTAYEAASELEDGAQEADLPASPDEDAMEGAEEEEMETDVDDDDTATLELTLTALLVDAAMLDVALLVLVSLELTALLVEAAMLDAVLAGVEGTDDEDDELELDVVKQDEPEAIIS